MTYENNCLPKGKKKMSGQPHIRGERREIDRGLRLGLHELGNPKVCNHSFRFQLEHSGKQAEDIRSNLPSLVDVTKEKAPLRTKQFCLNRNDDPKPRLTHEEDKWERSIYEKWGPKSNGEFLPTCKRVQTYQYPLRATLKDHCWGMIDLLGIGVDYLPVPIELKKRTPEESPLRMLVEVAAYGFAILKVWRNLKPDYLGSLQLPETLDRVTLICIAPEEYWCWCLGLLPEPENLRFPRDAWRPFWELVDDLGTSFDIHFGAIEGRWVHESGGYPEIFGARLLDLRLLTSIPAACGSVQDRARQARDALLNSYQRMLQHSPSLLVSEFPEDSFV